MDGIKGKVRIDLSKSKVKSNSYFKKLAKDFAKNKYIYIMAFPVVLYYIIFHYIPMYGAVIAFKYYSIADGVFGSEWAGFDHFMRFFASPFFRRVTVNTISINFAMLVCAFPSPIIFALLMNEIQIKRIKGVFQTISYLPHFISVIVICGMIHQFTGEQGIINDIIASFGGNRGSLLLNPDYFKPIYVISGIWTELGWESIIYLGALSGIDATLYEAAKIDGANKWKQTLNVTIPGIMPTIVIMLILRIGQMMDVGFEKIMLLYNASIMESADVISTYVYRVGLLNFNYDYSSAVGLFNSVINFALLIMANYVSKRVNGSGLW